MRQKLFPVAMIMAALAVASLARAQGEPPLGPWPDFLGAHETLLGGYIPPSELEGVIHEAQPDWNIQSSLVQIELEPGVDGGYGAAHMDRGAVLWSSEECPPAPECWVDYPDMVPSSIGSHAVHGYAMDSDHGRYAWVTGEIPVEYDYLGSRQGGLLSVNPVTGETCQVGCTLPQDWGAWVSSLTFTRMDRTITIDGRSMTYPAHNPWAFDFRGLDDPREHGVIRNVNRWNGETEPTSAPGFSMGGQYGVHVHGITADGQNGLYMLYQNPPITSDSTSGSVVLGYLDHDQIPRTITVLEREDGNWFGQPTAVLFRSEDDERMADILIVADRSYRLQDGGVQPNYAVIYRVIMGPSGPDHMLMPAYSQIRNEDVHFVYSWWYNEYDTTYPPAPQDLAFREARGTPPWSKASELIGSLYLPYAIIPPDTSGPIPLPDPAYDSALNYMKQAVDVSDWNMARQVAREMLMHMDGCGKKIPFHADQDDWVQNCMLQIPLALTLELVLQAVEEASRPMDSEQFHAAMEWESQRCWQTIHHK